MGARVAPVDAGASTEEDVLTVAASQAGGAVYLRPAA